MRAKTKAELVLLSLTIVWGSTFAIVKTVLAEVTPLQMVAGRFGVALVLLVLISGPRIFPLKSRAVGKGILLGLFLFAGLMVQTIGLQYTSASKSAFITGMTVLFVPLLQILVERRPPKLGNIIGVAMVSVGLWLLTSPEGSAFNIGDALTLACALLFAFYMVYLDMVSGDMSTAQLTFLQFAVNAVLGLAATLVLESLPGSVSGSALLSLLYLTLFATFLTTFLQTRYQKETTPTRAAIIFSAEPVVASVIAYLLLAESLGGTGAAGGGLIIAGVLVSELSDAVPVLNRSIGPAEP